MSARIYNAYKFEGSLKQLESIKNKIAKAYEADVLSALVAVEHIEVADISTPSIGTAGRTVWQNNQGKAIKDLSGIALFRLLEGIMARRLRDHLNFQASVVLYIHSGQMYLHFFGMDNLPKCSDFIRKLEKAHLLVDYHYQDSADKPDHISQKEWNQRKKMWDKILLDNTPAMAGFVFELDKLLIRICSQWEKQKGKQ